MRLIVPILLSLLVGVATAAELEDYTVVVGTKTDTAEFAVEDEKLVVKIRSTRGIGRVELRLKKKQAQWPKTIVLSLRYQDGKPLRELEGFTLAGETVRINGSRRTSGKMDCHDVNLEDPKRRDKNARKVNVLVEKTAKAMVVTIPGKLLEGERTLKMQWIDFYR